MSVRTYPHQKASRCFSISVACLLLALVVLTTSALAGAQSTGGRIRGTITDPSGGAVIAARVILINEATNVSRDTQAGENGEYLFLEIPVGVYEIDATQQGFMNNVRKVVALNLN